MFYALLAVSIVFSACKEEDDITAPTVLSGCTDAIATNYDPTATNDDGSCIFGIVGIWTPTSVSLDTTQTVTIAGDIVYEFDFGDGLEVLTASGNETLTPEEADMEGDAEFTADGKFISDNDTSSYTYENNVLTIDSAGIVMMVFTNCSITSTSLSLTTVASFDTAFTEPGLIMLGFTNGDVTISNERSMTINCSRSTAVNTNVSQKVGNTNHNWFVKPELNNIIKSIKK